MFPVQAAAMADLAVDEIRSVLLSLVSCGSTEEGVNWGFNPVKMNRLLEGSSSISYTSRIKGSAFQNQNLPLSVSRLNN